MKKVVLVIFLLTAITGYSQTTTVKATLYFPAVNQTDSSPYITATNKQIDRIDPFRSKYIAVSRLVESIYPMGTRVKITSTTLTELNGIYTVNDRMNRRYASDLLIDILVSEKLYKHLKKSRYTSGQFTIEKI